MLNFFNKFPGFDFYIKHSISQKLLRISTGGLLSRQCLHSIGGEKKLYTTEANLSCQQWIHPWFSNSQAFSFANTRWVKTGHVLVN